MKKVVVIGLGLALCAFVLVVMFFIYLQNKKDFYASAEAYILEPKQENLEKLSTNKIPEVVKKKIITELHKKYSCQLAFVTAAIGTLRNKSVITTADLNHCYNNYFSKEEAGDLATAIRKISEGSTEFEIFGRNTKIDFDVLLVSAGMHQKFIENVISIDSYFLQQANLAKEEELRNKPPEPDAAAIAAAKEKAPKNIQKQEPPPLPEKVEEGRIVIDKKAKAIKKPTTPPPKPSGPPPVN